MDRNPVVTLSANLVHIWSRRVGVSLLLLENRVGFVIQGTK